MDNVIAFIPLAFLIVLTLATKKMAESMTAAVILAALLLYRQNFLSGIADLAYGVLSDSSFQFVLMIMVGFGGMITLFQESGALIGFRRAIERVASGQKRSLFLAWLLALILCIDEYLAILTVTFSMRDVTDRACVPREHLAFQTNGMVCCFCMVIPFTSWTGFTVGLISEYGLGFYDYVASIPYLFFPLLLPLILLLLIFGGIPKKGQLKRAYERVRSGGPTEPTEQSESRLVEIAAPKEEKASAAWNILIPLAVLIAGVLLCGNDLICGLILALMAQFLLYIGQRLMTVGEFFGHFFEGAKSMSSVAILVAFGFMLSRANRALGLFGVLDRGFDQSIPPALLPLLAFVLVGLVVFSVGTCWVVMTITFPIFMPLALSCGVPASLMIGALMSGISLGYNLCFYSDATFMTAAGSGVSNVTIARTALPYALSAAFLAAIGFLIFGMITTGGI